MKNNANRSRTKLLLIIDSDIKTSAQNYSCNRNEQKDDFIIRFDESYYYSPINVQGGVNGLKLENNSEKRMSTTEENSLKGRRSTAESDKKRKCLDIDKALFDSNVSLKKQRDIIKSSQKKLVELCNQLIHIEKRNMKKSKHDNNQMKSNKLLPLKFPSAKLTDGFLKNLKPKISSEKMIGKADSSNISIRKEYRFELELKQCEK